MVQEVCMEHSGQCKAIETLEKNDVDIFKRLREVEMAVWKAAGASGIITALLVVVLERVMNRIQKYLLEGLVGAFLLLFLSWEIGYWCNALLGTKFDLQSCWNGFTTLSGAGVLAIVKYMMDSLTNSDRGKEPY